MAKNRGITDAVLKLRKEQPDLLYKQIAAIVGCPETTVQTACYRAGVGRRRVPQKKWKEAYLSLRKLHPSWNATKIAKQLGANRSTIYKIMARCEPDACVIRLGRAAMQAGLTIRQIQEMANARHA